MVDIVSFSNKSADVIPKAAFNSSGEDMANFFLYNCKAEYDVSVQKKKEAAANPAASSNSKGDHEYAGAMEAMLDKLREEGIIE